MVEEKKYFDILKKELVMALGCTEPIAIAYGAAKARQILGQLPEKIIVSCSGNIVKNVKGVTVPNSDGLIGIEAAAILGALGGNPDLELTVLETVTKSDCEKARELLAKNFCECKLIEGVAGLYIIIYMESNDDSVRIEIKDYHSNITMISKNGENIFSNENGENKSIEPDRSVLNVKNILDFADNADIKELAKIIEPQIKYNSAISEEGLKNEYGAQVGKSLLSESGYNDIRTRAKAAAAAGSDARMSGCAMPVVINSGSGNQGITVTMPVVEYAKEMKTTTEKLIRALAVSNLVAIHQKKYIGNLSAYCGVVSAACGSGVGIAYLKDYSYDKICNVITNTIATIGGMVCDGAKASCAAKIASAVDTAFTAINLSEKGLVFQPDTGLVKENVEKTIASIGRMGKEGMKSTDIEILNIMLER